MAKILKRRLDHQVKVKLFAFLCGLPGLLAALILLIAGDYTLKVYMTVFILVGAGWLFFSIQFRNTEIRVPLVPNPRRAIEITMEAKCCHCTTL